MAIGYEIILSGAFLTKILYDEFMYKKDTAHKKD